MRNGYDMFKLSRDDRGFTLIELLIAIVILGIIAVPLSNVLIGFLHNTDATSARFAESHDAQISAAYFAGDVASLGVRDWSGAVTPPPLTQSVELDAAATGGLFPCGTASTPDAVLRLAWDDFSSGPAAASTQTRVAYVIQTVAGETQLHRLTCAGSATVSSDLVLAHELVSATAACSSSCTAGGANLPQTISLTLTMHDPRSTSANYVVVLNGQRRQT